MRSSVPTRVRKPLSPRAHRRFDRLALPGLVGAALLLARRDRAAAALLLMTAAGEGAAQFVTSYPPPVLFSWLTLEQHLRVGNLHAAFVAALALGVPGVRRRHRALVLGVAAVPVVLNALTDVRPAGARARTRPLVRRWPSMR